MDSDDDAKRAVAQSTFLRSFEEYIDQVVMQNHGIKREEILRIVKENFQRSMKANAVHHNFMAKAHNGGDSALEAYHKLMADVYRSLL